MHTANGLEIIAEEQKIGKAATDESELLKEKIQKIREKAELERIKA